MTHSELIKRKDELVKEIASLRREQMFIEQQLQQIYADDWAESMKLLRQSQDQDLNNFMTVRY